MAIVDKSLTRREGIKEILRISGAMAFGALMGPLENSSRAWAGPDKKGFIVEGVGRTQGYALKDLTRKVFEAAGGINRFISRGDVVAIKPNLSWAMKPEMAATTNPEVLEAVILLCQEAGAKKVIIADHTINDARRCFAVTGAGMTAQKTHAELIFPSSSLMKEMKIKGHRLDTWPVYTPLIEADKLINLPIAKTHGMSTLTLGMKNWIGAVGGRPNALHQDLHQTIVDLAQFFKPVVTLIDAFRIMTGNGPSGGSLSDVMIKDTLILSDDPVAGDAFAAQLFGLNPQDIGFIKLAKKWGLGTDDQNQLEIKKIIL